MLKRLENFYRYHCPTKNDIDMFLYDYFGFETPRSSLYRYNREIETLFNCRIIVNSYSKKYRLIYNDSRREKET